MSDPRRNAEGYLDVTAYLGTKNVIQEENEAERKNKDLIHTFRLLADMAGFEIVGRITIKHKKAGVLFIQMIGYLSGPITGHKDYRRQFAKAAAALKERGYNVINPAAIDDAIPVECMSYEEIMRIDLELLSTADYLVQLPGWERSIGASRELGFALGTDKIIVSLEQLLTKEVMLS